MPHLTYDEACAAATTRQGLDPVIERLTAEGFPVSLEQTGGFCMVVTVTFGGHTYCVISDGMDPARPYLLVVYKQEAWHDTGEDSLSDTGDLSLDEVVTALRDAQAVTA